MNVIELRRELHRHPEIAFDLPNTLAVVRRELDRIGISFTEKYGKSGIVATINPEKEGFTVGLRADMDALPVTEANDVPYKSEVPGKMHACGHDAHTSILLGTAERLFACRERIGRVRLIFQPAEESNPGGAALMVADGAGKLADVFAALHCQPGIRAGQISVSGGDYNAESNSFFLHFKGKNAHVQNQEDGVDAIAMAVSAYSQIETYVAKRICARSVVIFNAGTIHGGKAHNVICDECYMSCTLRTWEDGAAPKILADFSKILDGVALSYGGEAWLELTKTNRIVHNDPSVAAALRKSAETVLGAENIIEWPREMGAEDFSCFSREKPSCMFRLGVDGRDGTCHGGLHQSDFDLDESALEVGIGVFTQFVLDCFDGTVLSGRFENSEHVGE